MLQLLKPKFTVEQIHNEIDTATDRLLESAMNVLKELKIPLATDIERKATLMKDLGFGNSVTVKQAQSLIQERQRTETTLISTREEACILSNLSEAYPNQKILTIKEFDRICNKYGLIYASANKYKEDVPEKNLLEIKNASKLKYEHTDQPHYSVQNINFSGKNHSKRYQKAVREFLSTQKFSSNEMTEHELRRRLPDHIKALNTHTYLFYNAELMYVHKTGLFIAAPASHFNLKGLKNKGLGFFSFTTITIKDPIAFEFLKYDMVRIISKWGTADDQSYLDPALVNEKMN